jgi:hypothetical protein
MKTEKTRVYGLGNLFNKIACYLRTFNPLAAGSIPARPTRKQKGFRQLAGSLFLWPHTAKSTKVYVLGLVAALLVVFSAGSARAETTGWDFYFFGVNTKLFKEANYKMMALGAATALAVHIGGHYAYAAANGMSVTQDGLEERISGNYPDHKIRWFMLSGFIAQHAVGLALTTIPATRQTDFTRGYVAFAWAETLSYPLRNNERGDLYSSDRHGGNRDLEYMIFSAIATHNVLRVKWYKE